MDTKVCDVESKPIPVYRGLLKRSEFQNNIMHSSQWRGYYFSSQPHIAKVYTSSEGSILTNYVNIQKPYFGMYYNYSLPAGIKRKVLFSVITEEDVLHMKNAGYDGWIIDSKGTEIIAFDKDQIAIAEEM